MRKPNCLLFAVISAVSFNLYAIEPVLDHQAYVYFNIPLAGASQSANQYSFGLRLDRSLIQTPIDSGFDLNKPALFGLEMDKHGIWSFELGGIRVTESDYYIYHGAEAGNGKTTANDESAEPQATDAPEQQPEQEYDWFTKAIVNAPADVQIGVAIGAIIGVFALSGG